jgi:D-glycero-D-manno-heptose 1,7-bisphosphate phosphatase
LSAAAKSAGLASTTGQRAVFLDRDGVINEDLGYVSRIEDFRLIEGAVEGLKLLQALGLHLVIVTNQSGIGRGFYTQAHYEALTAAYLQQLAMAGVTFTGVLHCPHQPTEDCECRKPKPGMLFEGARRWNFDLRFSYLVGDKPSDIEAGKAAGLRACVLVAREPTSPTSGSWTSPDLLGAARQIKAMESD